MKSKTVKLVKGESVVFVNIHGCDADGRATDVDSLTNGYSVSLGGNCGIHLHDARESAEAEAASRIGRLVLDGYAAENPPRPSGPKVKCLLPVDAAVRIRECAAQRGVTVGEFVSDTIDYRLRMAELTESQIA